MKGGEVLQTNPPDERSPTRIKAESIRKIEKENVRWFVMMV